MASFNITGKLRSNKDQHALAGLTVEAWDKDLLFNDLVGKAVTDKTGDFKIKFDQSYFKKIFPDRNPDLFFKIYKGQRLLASTENDVLWNQKTGPAKLIIEIETTAEDKVTDNNGISIVTGKLTEADGSPVKGAIVKVLFIKIRSEELLGESKTEVDGTYLVKYSTSTQTDILVRAYLGKEEIASSLPLYKVTKNKKVNLVTGGKTLRGPSEYRRIEASLKDKLDGLSLSVLEDNEINILAGKTRIPAERLKKISTVQQLAEKYSLNPEPLYALINSGKGANLLNLASQPANILHNTIKSAAEKNIIPAEFAEKSEQFIDKLQTAAAKDLLNPSVGGSLDGLLNLSSLNTKQKESFSRQIVKNKASRDEFWTKLEDAGFKKDEVNELKNLATIDRLSGGHLPLVKALKGKGATDIGELAGWDAGDWENYIVKNKTGVPDDISGKTAGEKVKNYSARLAKNFELSYPAKRVASKLQAMPDNDDLNTFLKLSPDFDISTDHAGTFLKKNSARLNGKVKDTGKLEKDLKSWQRLYRITPSTAKTENMKVLKDAGFDSGLSIVKGQTKKSFVKKFSGALGGEAEAKIVYHKAVSAASTAVSLMGNLANGITGLPFVIPGLAGENNEIDLPDLETLFGSQSYCECEHCRSVLSPAAYLVDLLEFLRTSDTNDSGNTPKDVLFSRRPDLGDIELSCINTNTALPYIDLVNEVLENAVLLHNGKAVDYGYQTTGTTQELQAQPEHINADAYTIVGGAVYPFNLPFHMWNDEGAIYLKKLGIQRYELLRSTQFTGNSNEPSDLSVACVHLGISENERKIISGEMTIGTTTYHVQNFWGENTIGWIGRLSNVDYFLDKTNLEYSDILQLLQVTFINPDDNIVIDFSGSSSVCDISGAVMHYEDGSALDRDFFNRMHRFLRLKIKTGLKILELKMAINAIGENELNDTLFIHLSCILRLKTALKIKSLPLLLNWWADVDTSHDKNDEESRSFYETLFLNKAVSNPVESVFELNAEASRLTVEDSGTIPLLTDYKEYIAASINISASNLDLLISTLGNSDLTLNNLSYLCRHASAAKAFRLSMEEFLALKELLPFDLFSNNDSTEAIEFYEAVSDIKNSGFRTEELDYIFRHNYDTGDSFVPSSTAIDKVLTQLQNGIRKIQDENNFDSDPTGEITRTKLGLLLDETTSQQIIDIIHERSALSSTEQEDLIDTNLAFLDPAGALANLLTIDATIPQETRIQNRYSYLLEPLTTYLVLILSSDFASQTLASSLNIDLDTSNSLLTQLVKSPAPSTRLAIDEFLDDAFINYEYGEGETISLELFSTQYNTYILLHKAAVIAGKFDFNNEELVWTYNNIASTGWLDLNALPVEYTESSAGLFESWRLMYQFSVFNKKYRTGDTSMFGLLNMGVYHDSYDPPITIDIFKENIIEFTLWESSDLDFLTATSAFDLGLDQFRDGSALYKLNEYMEFVARTGSAAESLWSWISTDLDEAKAIATKQASKAKYSNEQWLSVAPSLRDQLRGRQRDALTAYLIAEEGFEDETDLLEHYLIDVEMEPGMLTSRIKQACSSLQMFIQRSFMGLEADVTLDEDQQELWEWMKQYRIWEANRKVFLYPENWLEPELRDSQSEFFEELQNELLQNEISDDNVEVAFTHYLEKLDEVSTIDVIATYHQKETSDDEDKEIDIFHVIGRTKSYPHIYYYRKREEGAWGPWEKVDADIDGDYAMLSVINRRLFLLWPSFIEVQKDAGTVIKEFEFEDGAENFAGSHGYSNLDDYISEELTQPYVRYEIKMAYSEYKSDKWLPKKLTKEAIDSESLATLLLYLNGVYKLSLDNFCFYVSTSANSITVSIYQRVVFYADGSDQDQLYTLGTVELNTLTKEFVVTPESHIYADFWLLYGIPFPADASKKLIKTPDDTILANNTFEEIAGTNYLVLYSRNESDEYQGKTVLGLTPGTFRIPIPVQYSEFLSTDSFFYYDDEKSFFVTPVELTYKSADELVTMDKKSKKTGSSADKEHSLDIGTTLRYKFETFYHPFSMEFIKTLNRDGIKGFMNRSTQIQELEYFDATYAPKAVTTPYPIKDIDFDYGSANAIYNWELFFHAPMLIANHLSQNQQFEEAQKWYHFIFNPTDRTEDENPTPQRYWQLKPFFEETTLSSIYEMMNALSYTGSDEATLTLKEEVEAQIKAWKDDPFDPHTIAGLRITAYMKSLAMKYIDNLISWGDSLFRQDTIESINEATQLYVLALKILGDRPEEIPQEETEDKSYNELLENGIDAFSNSLIELEGYVNSSSSSSSSSSESSVLFYNLYFCIPHNEKLLKYWDTVEDRLFKLRNCMNIEGVKRSLALFEPPIDPGMLVKAKAAGVDLGSVLADLNTPLPSYRFKFYIQKAAQFCAEVQSMGTMLLSVLEKRDAEELSLIRAGHELKLQEAGKDLKRLQLNEAKDNLESIVRSREIADTRLSYYKTIQKMIQLESSNIILLNDSDKKRKKAGSTDIIAATMHALPNLSVGFTGGFPEASVSFGGSNLGSILNAVATSFRNDSANFTHQAGVASIKGGYERRWSDWKLQEKLAEKEIKQIDKQIASAEIKVQIMEKELENHELQQEQSREIFAFMSDKFTNKELYQWMSSQLSTLYFQSYQLAYDCAKRVQKAFQYELGSSQTFVQYGYWDSLKKGLLAGDKLQYDMKRMEMAYYEQNKRGYEITKNISLAVLDPMALLMLKQTGECYIELPESIFDIDYPGHYMRRIKSVSLTVPCIAGPYTGLNCTLTLMENSYRLDTSVSDGYAEVDQDNRFVYNQASIQSIATSTGRNDSGLFQLNFEDDRYVPFEGAGAISKWKLHLPTVFRAFDYNSISDVIMHLSYTAREGGETLRTQVEGELQDAILAMALGSGNSGLTRMFSLKNEYSGDWYRFLNPPASQTGQNITMQIDADKFPYLFRNYEINIHKADVCMIIASSYFTETTTIKIGVLPPSGTSNEPTLSSGEGVNNTLLVNIDSLSESAGQWTITIDESEIPDELKSESDGHPRLNTDAILDLILICHYSIS